MTGCAAYLIDFLEPVTRQLVLQEAICQLGNADFDTIAIRGVSGALFGASLATHLNKKLAVIRKGEDTHSGFSVECMDECERYIIVDDLIDTGTTMIRIIEKMNSVFEGRARCIGIYLYSTNSRTKEEKTQASWNGIPILNRRRCKLTENPIPANRPKPE